MSPARPMSRLCSVLPASSALCALRSSYGSFSRSLSKRVAAQTSSKHSLRIFSTAPSVAASSTTFTALCSSTKPPILEKAVARHIEKECSEYQQLLREMETGDFDVKRAKRVGSLEPLVQAQDELRRTVEEVLGLRELISDSSAETELREMAKEELKQNESNLEEQRERLLSLITPSNEQAPLVTSEKRVWMGDVCTYF
eukprot:5206567-Pleurochrysis_carterae.AAC.3